MNFAHGGNIRKVAESFEIDESTIIDFSANINPLGISAMAREAISETIASIVNYPDPESSRLIKALSQYHKIAVENILAGNGATELIYLLPRALKLKSSLIIAPAFSEYERALVLSNCNVEHLLLSPDNNFEFCRDDLFTAMEKGYDSIWIGNPANPTGRIIEKDEIIKIAEKAAYLGTMLIVDEAFIDFCEEKSVKKEVKRLPNLIILRSMTKFFALAGLRAGYLFAHENVISRLVKHKEPWSLNSIAEAAALASLGDSPYIKKTIEFIKMERTFLLQELQKINALTVYDSHANYLLLKLGKSGRAEYLQEKLLKEYGILIRNCGNYIGLSSHYMRVAIKGREDNKVLIAALSRLLNNQEIQE